MLVSFLYSARAAYLVNLARTFKIFFFLATLRPFIVWADPSSAWASNETFLHIRDLPDNAFTSSKGTGLFRAFQASSFGVLDSVDVKSSLLSLGEGASFGLEFAPWQSAEQKYAVSIDTDGLLSYSGKTSGQILLRGSYALGQGYVHGSLGAHRTSQPALRIGKTLVPTRSAWALPASLSYTYFVSGKTALEARALMWWGWGTESSRYAILGGRGYQAFGRHFQLGVGLFLLLGNVPPELSTIVRVFGATPAPFSVLLFPELQFTFRL